MPPDSGTLLATVIAVFTATKGGAGQPEDVAEELLTHEDVSTVRVNAHGQHSAYRVDVPDEAHDHAAERAAALAHAVAISLDLDVEVVAVGLVRDTDRAEVFREGDPSVGLAD